MTDKKNDLGFDPLAWADDGSNNSLNIELLEQSFAALAPRAGELVKRFYDDLYSRYPAVRPLFKNTTSEAQQTKLVAALQLVIKQLRDPSQLTNTLQQLGKKHQQYGAIEAHYSAVAETLLAVMADMAGDLWTPEVANAWSQALTKIAEIMLGAYESNEGVTMSTSSSDNSNVLGDLKIITDIMDNAPVNIMIADDDENVIYVNNRAKAVLTELESELQKYLPQFSVATVVGGSIHRYHKDPQAIKNIIQGLRPGESRKGEIKPGPFVFEHETRPLMNANGQRLGWVVQWHDVTERRKKEEEAFRLFRAVDSAQTAMMMIDRDLTITYINKSTEELLKRNQEDLAKIYPGFNANNIIGTCIDIFHKNPAHQRKILGDAANLPFETDIQVGPLIFHIRVGAMNDLDGNYIGCTLEWSDVTDLRAKEIEVARFKSAVDGAATNLMLCNENFEITYVNPSVQKMMQARQADLRQVFPGFDASNLIGQNIDQFHKNPAHQRSLLSDVNRLPARAPIHVADLDFEVNATAILSPSGEWMGNMVEWKDITEQKNAERQIEQLIIAASSGDLNTRIDVSKFDGFLRELGQQINALLEAVVSPIRESTRVVKALSVGDLRELMTGEFEGEFAVMRDSLNQSMNNLKDMVSKINSSTTNMSSAAAEIAQGNADLSQRTEEQASSLEETASSMEELTSTVKQNADNARQANQLASGAREQAEKGGDVVQRAVSAMSEINSSSKKISDIIGVIDEIAFQTNLLALNAAVEAARAGEQGRGFAVVAGEVRNLAQRSAGAAKEIKSLIQDSVEKVDDGTKLVDQSGQTLTEIVAAVKKVSDIIAEIAAASQEQSSGIEQVNKAVTQMDEVTQQNAALVEEAAAASESMDEQAKGLQTLMQFFKLDESHSSGIGIPPAPQMSSAPRATAPSAPSRPMRGNAAPSTDDDEWQEF